MKRLNHISISISCFLIILLSSSCKKDSLNSAPSYCDTCNTIVLNCIFLNASNWIKQDGGLYSSDITSNLKQAGISVSKVYAIDIDDGTSLSQIYPENSGDYLGGSFSVSINLSNNLTKDEDTCILIYGFSTEEHFGKFRP
jgi:hypothetical protein